MNRSRIAFWAIGAAAATGALWAVALSFRQSGPPELVQRVLAQVRGGPEMGGVPPMPVQQIRGSVPEARLEVVARNLEIPWTIAFAPDGRVFFTERPGRIRVVKSASQPLPWRPETYRDMASVVASGEGGLMGLALHPDFARSPYLYVMYTTRKRGVAVNRV